MPVFQIANEVDDGYVALLWGTSTSSTSTGGIGLTVTCYADGNISFSWTPIVGQASYQFVVKNSSGVVVWAPGCGGVQPDDNGQTSSGEPLAGRTDGPFTFEIDFYSGSVGLCNGAIIASATASGWTLPINGFSDYYDKLLIGDRSKVASDKFNASAWMRFTNVTIPQGATILSAKVTVQAYTKSNIPPSTLYLRVRAEDTDDATNPTSYFNYWDDVGIGKQRVPGAGLLTGITAWDPGVSYEYTITSIIQHIVDRPGWSSGNAMLVFFEDYDESHNTDIWIQIQDYPSLSAPTLTIEYGIPGVGSAAGTSTANATTIWGARGDAAGQSVVDGFGAFTLTVTGSAAGTSTVNGVGASEAAAVGTAAGTSDADGAEGRQAWAAVGTADGTSDADGAPTEIEWISIGTSAGTSTVLATGISSNQAVGSAAGTSTVTGVGLSENETAGASAGTSSVLAKGASEGRAAGTSAGQADADDAEGLQGWDSIGSADGAGAASGVGSSEARSIGISSGSSTAAAEREILFLSTGISSGVASVHAAGSRGLFITGVAIGSSKAVGRILPYQRIWLQDLSQRLGVRSVGQDSARFLELNGATIIEPTAFEPDPATHRESHYYNAVTNTLYRKVVTRREPGVVVAYWQKVSD